MNRPRDMRDFPSWNEDMVARYDPDAYHTRSPWPVRVLERMRVRAVVRALAAPPGARVLEVGCGAGNVLEAVEAERFGIDLSPSLLGKARARLGRGARLCRGDAARLPFCDGAFDRVYCSEVLEHVLEPEAVLREMRRVLRPGGFVVVSIPNEDLINRAKRWAFALPLGRRILQGSPGGYRVSDKMDDEWHLHEFSPARLRQAAEGVFAVDTLIGVPLSQFALRHVARLTPR